MSIDDTYVPIFRSLLNHRYMRDAAKLQFWVWCLLKASHKEHKVLVGNQTITLNVGDFVFGRKAASYELGITEQSVRTLLKFFSSEIEQKLTIKSTNKFSVITVIDYASYMDKVKQINQHINQHLTSNQPAANHKQEGKEGKEEKYIADFEKVWTSYPIKLGKKAAERHFRATVKTEEDFQNILYALNNYQTHLKRETWKKPQNGSTWFNNWQDWIPNLQPAIPIVKTEEDLRWEKERAARREDMARKEKAA